MRDHEMVERAEVLFSAWHKGHDLRRGEELMADFAAAEVARAQEKAVDGDKIWLIRRLDDAEAQRDAAVARAEQAEKACAERHDLWGQAEARADKAEAALTKGHLSRDGAPPVLGDTVTTADGRVWCWMPRDVAPVSREAFDAMAQQRCDAVDRAIRSEARVRALEAAAAKPAPYVPKVGDVVTPTKHHLGAHFLLKSINNQTGSYTFAWIRASYAGTKYSMNDSSSRGVLDFTYLRPSTPAERKAAGLPSAEPVEDPSPDLAALRAAVVDADAAHTFAQGLGDEEYARAYDAYKRACASLDAAVKAAKGGEHGKQGG